MHTVLREIPISTEMLTGNTYAIYVVFGIGISSVWYILPREKNIFVY
jgi:hypothetical protein